MKWEVVVPVVVETEIQQYGKEDITVQSLAQTSWLVVVNTPPIPNVIQSYQLGAGESAVLTWAYVNPNSEVILDDLAARRCASALGIPVRGTLGLVLTAKQLLPRKHYSSCETHCRTIKSSTGIGWGIIKNWT
ncbi:MAG: hypothetical protein ABFS56_20060 [Pseudomonadota bacterium]